MNELSLETIQAIQHLETLKRVEAEARESRIRAEEALIAMIPNDKSEGSVSLADDNITVTVTKKLNRKIDFDLLERQWDNLPELKNIVRYKREVNLPYVRKIMEFGDTMTQNALNSIVTATPAKTSVSIKRKIS